MNYFEAKFDALQREWLTACRLVREDLELCESTRSGQRAVNPLPAPIPPKRWRYNSTVEGAPGVVCGVVFRSTQSNALGEWA